MKIISGCAAAILMAGCWATVQAAPQGFGAPTHSVGPISGFNQADMRTMSVDEVRKFAYDDQIVHLRGKLVNFKGGEWYTFQDEKGGQIYVELDDDYPWTHISRGQLIDIVAEVDRDAVSVTLDVKSATPVQ